MGDRKAAKSRASQRRRRLGKPRLEALIAEATVDAYGESEQLGGFYTIIDDHLAVPFESSLLGVPVTMRRVDLTERNEIDYQVGLPRLHQAEVTQDLLVVRDQEPVTLPAIGLSPLLGGTVHHPTGVRVKSCHSRCHCSFRLAGTISRPRRTRRVAKRARAAAIACAVLPSPMWSASSRRVEARNRATPSI